MVPADWVRLPIQAPPTMEVALGYNGNGKWVAFNFSPYGDESTYEDGTSSGTGDWNGYLTCVHHRKVWPHLVGYNLGSSDGKGTHRLIVDRTSRAIYVGPNRSAEDWLLKHSPVKIPPEILERAVTSFQDFVDVRKFQEVKIDMAAVVAAMRRRGEIITAMQEHLDKQ